MVGGPTTSTSSTSRPGATDPIASTMPGVRATRIDAGPVGAHACRDRGALRAAPHDVFAGEQDAHRPSVPVGEPPGDVADFGRHLPTERTAVAERARRLAARLAPRGVRLEVRRLHPGGLQRAHPVAGRQLDRPSQRRRRAPSLDLGAEPARLGQRLAHHPFAVDVEQRDQRVGRGGVVGEPARARARRAAPRPAPPHPPTMPAPPARVCPRCTGGAIRGRQNGGDDGVPAGAAAEVGEHRLAHRGLGGVGERGDAHDDSRRAEAALAAAVVGERFRPALGVVEALDRRHRASGDAPTGVTQATRAGRRPTPCSTRIDPGGCSRPSPT